MIKYIDKIDSIENKIFYSSDFELASTSLEGLIENIRNSSGYEQKKESSYKFMIAIINTGNNCYCTLSDEIDRIGGDKEINIYEEKAIVSSIAYNRYIAISSNLDEIYYEVIYVCIDDGCVGWNNYSFDYGLMYGDYEKYNELECVDIRYPHSENIDALIITKVESPTTKLKVSDLHKEIGCMYSGDLYDSDGEFIAFMYTTDVLPVSLFGVKIDDCLNCNIYHVSIKIVLISNTIENYYKATSIHASNKENAIEKARELISKNVIQVPDNYDDLMIKATNMDDEADCTEWEDF